MTAPNGGNVINPLNHNGHLSNPMLTPMYERINKPNPYSQPKDDNHPTKANGKAHIKFLTWRSIPETPSPPWIPKVKVQYGINSSQR